MVCHELYMPATDCALSLKTVHCLPPTVHSLLPTVHGLLPTVHVCYQLYTAVSVDSN
jgi:hypothetical protein